LNIRFETKPFTLKPREYPEVLRILKQLLAASSYLEPKCYTPCDDACADGSLEDYQLLAYHFNIPEYLCGKLIGIEGTFINELKTECRVNIYLREISGENEKKKKKLKSRRQYDRRRYDEPTNKLCCIEGTRTNIDKCLNKLKKKFNTNTEVTFEQVNRSKGSHPITHHNGNVTLALAEGVMHDVFVSSIVGGGHVFLQQPCHPTYWALEGWTSA